MKNFVKCFVIVFIIYLYGCNRDEVISPPPDIEAFDGAYILSEGGTTPETSKLSFYNLANDIFTENISSSPLGLFPDGLILDNGQLFVSEQGNFGSAGKVYKIDTTGAVINSQTAGTNPYSLTSANGKLYLTNGPANIVTVVDKNTLNFITTVNVGTNPQEILSIGNRVFVCNTSNFAGSTDSSVSVIDAGSDQLIATINVRKTPSSLAVTNDGKLLVGCPGNSNSGIIYKFDPDNFSRLDSFVISGSFAAGFDKDIAVDRISNDIYFISFFNNIIKYNMSTRTYSVFINNFNTQDDFYYGYNFDSKNRKHYIANAKNFVINGNIQIYDESGNVIKTYTTGLAPRRIVIKN